MIQTLFTTVVHLWPDNTVPCEYFRRLLPYLKELKLPWVYSAEDLFAGNWPLETLHLWIDPPENGTPAIKLPDLNELYVNSYVNGIDLTEYIIVQMLSHVPQLRNLEIERFNISLCAWTLLSRFLPNIEVLRLSKCEFDVDLANSMIEWSEYKCLKSLSLCGMDPMEVEEVLRSLVIGAVELQRLEVICVINDNIINYIGQTFHMISMNLSFRLAPIIWKQ